MGKRSNFERKPLDFYPTPYKAVLPLLAHIPPSIKFIEPCAGEGHLVRHLEQRGHKCVFAGDIEQDATVYDYSSVRDGANWVITNPPWTADIKHAILDNLFNQRFYVAFLMSADWAHNKHASKYLERCNKIISVGRVKWEEGSKYTGKDNVAWYLFKLVTNVFPATCTFIGRQ